MACSPNPAVFGPHVSSAPPSPKCLYDSSWSLSRVFNTLFLVYAVIQSYEVQHSVTTVSSQGGFSHIKIDILTMALPIVIGIAELAYIMLAWTIYNEFGWKVYKFRRGLKDQSTSMSTFLALLDLTLVLQSCASKQLAQSAAHTHRYLYSLTR